MTTIKPLLAYAGLLLNFALAAHASSQGINKAVQSPLVKSLSLNEAVQLCFKNNENIEQAGLDMQIAQAKIREAWGSALPQISITAQTIRHLKSPVIQFGNEGIPIKQDWELLSRLQINQALYTFGRVSQALEIAKSMKSMSQVARQAVARELRFAVELAYYSTLSTQEVLETAKQSLENAKKNQRALEKRFSGGRTPRFDNLKMSADIAARVPLVSDAKKNLELAYFQLNLLLDLPENARPELTTSMRELFPKLSEESLLGELSDSPVIKGQELAVKMSTAQEKLASANHFPTLSAFAAYDYSGTGMEMPPEDERLFESTSVGLQLSIPLFEGGAVSAKKRQAALENVKTQMELRKKRRELITELKSSIGEYKSNLEKYTAGKEAYRLAKQAYELTRQRFQAGQATRVDLNASENALTSSRLQQINSLFQIYHNQASIKRLTQNAEI